MKKWSFALVNGSTAGLIPYALNLHLDRGDPPPQLNRNEVGALFSLSL